MISIYDMKGSAPVLLPHAALAGGVEGDQIAHADGQLENVGHVVLQRGADGLGIGLSRRF